MKTLGMICVALACSSHAAAAERLYSGETYHSLVADHTSHDVGQSLTVLILEEASAATAADTDLEKSFDVGGSAQGDGKPYAADLTVSNVFRGGGTISRSGQLVASVSVVIRQVLPSGELYVEGEQQIELNEEKQHIKVAGRIRPQDISPDNTVLSTRIADSSITYLGEGMLGNRQKRGAIPRFLDWLF